CLLLACIGLSKLSFSHTNGCLKCLILLVRKTLVNGSLLVSTTAPFSFNTLLYSAQSGSNGIIVSHLHEVVPYGKSANIKSTPPTGIRFITSKQSPCAILFNKSSITRSPFATSQSRQTPTHNSLSYIRAGLSYAQYRLACVIPRPLLRSSR